MAKAASDHNEDPDQAGDLELASKRRREANLRLTMSERLERLDRLSRQLVEIKGVAKR